jgi:hypothetical protein
MFCGKRRLLRNATILLDDVQYPELSETVVLRLTVFDRPK